MGWKLAMAIVVVVAFPAYGAPALTYTVPDVLPEDAPLTRSPAVPRIPEQFVAPAETVREAAEASTAAAPSQEQTLNGNPLWAIPLAVLRGTRERPVFSPSRRPPAPVAVRAPEPKPASPPKPKEPERPKLSLVGTVEGGGESLGIFFDPSTKASLRLRAGDYYEGWRLESIQTREATLEKDRQAVTLALPRPGARQPAYEAPSLPSNVHRLLSAMSPQRRERSH